MDQYGCFIGLELFEGAKNYVFITGFDRPTSSLSISTAKANAIFLDGTMHNITVNAKAANDNIDADGVYTLKPCVRMTATKNERSYGEDDTVFITVSLDESDTSGGDRAIAEVDGVYSGVQNVEIEELIDAEEAQIYTVYNGGHYMAAAIAVGEAMGSGATLEELRAMNLKEAAKKVEAGIEETLTYCDFPSEHWTRIRTNNVIVRLNREIRRRTRVVGCFPDGNSALMLVCARPRHAAGTQWGSKKYMNMKHLDAALVGASIAG